MDKTEKYFKLNNCEYILYDVFAYNENETPLIITLQPKKKTQ